MKQFHRILEKELVFFLKKTTNFCTATIFDIHLIKKKKKRRRRKRKPSSYPLSEPLLPLLSAVTPSDVALKLHLVIISLLTLHKVSSRGQGRGSPKNQLKWVFCIHMLTLRISLGIRMGTDAEPCLTHDNSFQQGMAMQ